MRLDQFWTKKFSSGRKNTNCLNVLKTLVSYQLISPGSEWRLHREWFRGSAIGYLLGENDP
ncbi:MAG: hypothetical protein WBB23_21515 [Desulforhopalus sp.]